MESQQQQQQQLQHKEEQLASVRLLLDAGFTGCNSSPSSAAESKCQNVDVDSSETNSCRSSQEKVLAATKTRPQVIAESDQDKLSYNLARPHCDKKKEWGLSHGLSSQAADSPRAGPPTSEPDGANLRHLAGMTSSDGGQPRLEETGSFSRSSAWRLNREAESAKPAENLFADFLTGPQLPPAAPGMEEGARGASSDQQKIVPDSCRDCAKTCGEEGDGGKFSSILILHA